MSTFVLKIVAIIAMLIDHLTVVINPANDWVFIAGRLIGRIAFPIFIFLIVEGFYNTSNVKNYLRRLGIFALISELPFDLAFYNSFYAKEGGNIKIDLSNMFSDGQVFDTVIKRFMGHQNVFFTLFLGLLTIWLMSMIEKKYSKNMLYVNILNAVVTLAVSIAAAFLRTDYNYRGILLIVAFYLFRGSNLLLLISMLILSSDIVTAFAALAVIPIAFYNGKKGKDIKYFFYIFYPAHIFILFILQLFI
ncbi:MAG: hypothetical protein GX271_10535 [Clostridiales bacterium]|jgi:hypothetical protein|nr:hypothetical protein [Clostridiales bacterium]